MSHIFPKAGTTQQKTGEGGWRDDLRLFAFTWMAAFLFFIVLIG